MLFSIITIVRNSRGAFLRTRASVLAQSCTAFEWIVVDGCSTDGTLQEIQSTDFPRLRYDSAPDRGIYDAMNKGVLLARGRYILFLNSGDTFVDETTLDKLKAFVEGSGDPGGDPAMVYGDALELTAAGDLLFKKARSHRRVWYGMFTHHQAIAYRRSLAVQTMFDLSYRVAGDYEFTARFLVRWPRAAYCEFPVCIFEKGGFSENNMAVGRRENFRVQRSVLNVPILQAIGVQIVYWMSALSRRYLQKLYRLIRYSPWAGHQLAAKKHERMGV